MAVYTSITSADLSAFLSAYALPPLRDFSGIESGTENTNYFVHCGDSSYVLTLFESMPAQAVEYFIGLNAYLNAQHQPVARPIAARDGQWVSQLLDKPATIVTRLPGQSVAKPDTAHCQAIGAALARLHLAASDYKAQHGTHETVTRRRGLIAQLEHTLDDEQADLADSLLAMPELEWDEGLPGGIIHADLFRDNALFERGALSGIIDFYYAHRGPFIYDIAVSCADWCFMPELQWRGDLAAALIQAYAALRPLSAAEREAWPCALENAAARFWLSRLRDLHFPRGSEIGRIKDPAPFAELLSFTRARRDLVTAVWQ